MASSPLPSQQMGEEIQPEALEAVLDSTADPEDPVIVDIRAPSQYQREHIPASINIPLAELPAKVHDVADATHVVTVCPHGKASLRAAELIDSYGEFDGRVESLASGLEAWHGPLESHGETAADQEPEAPF